MGFSASKGRFEFTHDEPIVLRALRRVADDLANRYVVLGDIWDIDAKRAYLDRLEGEGILPTAANSLASKQAPLESKPAVVRPVQLVWRGRKLEPRLYPIQYTQSLGLEESKDIEQYGKSCNSTLI